MNPIYRFNCAVFGGKYIEWTSTLNIDSIKLFRRMVIPVATLLDDHQ